MKKLDGEYGSIVKFGLYGIIALSGCFCLWKYKPWNMIKLKLKDGGVYQQFMENKKIEAIKPESISTVFKDVAGMHEAKF